MHSTLEATAMMMHFDDTISHACKRRSSSRFQRRNSSRLRVLLLGLFLFSKQIRTVASSYPCDGSAGQEACFINVGFIGESDQIPAGIWEPGQPRTYVRRYDSLYDEFSYSNYGDRAGAGGGASSGGVVVQAVQQPNMGNITDMEQTTNQCYRRLRAYQRDWVMRLNQLNEGRGVGVKGGHAENTYFYKIRHLYWTYPIGHTFQDTNAVGHCKETCRWWGQPSPAYITLTPTYSLWHSGIIYFQIQFYAVVLS